MMNRYLRLPGMVLSAGLAMAPALPMVMVPIILDLSGCANAGAVTPAAVVADAQAIVAGLAATIPKLQAAAPGLIKPADAAKVLGYIQQAQTALTALSADLPAQQGASILSQVEGYINAALDTLATIQAIPQPFAGYIQAASALLPVVEAFVNATLGTASRLAATRAAHVAMSADQARALLRSAAGG